MRPGILDSITGVNQQLAQQNVAPQSDSIDLSQSDISNFDPASGRASTSEFESIQTNDSVSGTGNMTNADFFPSANQPIQKGSISTKTFGGTPIFVPSAGLTPLNILDKKEAALDEIKRKRQERQAKLDLGAPPKLADARFQKSVDNAFMHIISWYKSISKDMYGKDWDIGLTSDQTELGRRFKQEMRDLQTLKSQADVVTKQAADIISKVEAGEISTDSKSYQLANEIMKGIGEYEKGNATDLTKNINQFKQSVVLDNWLNKNILGQLKMTESAGPLRTLANAIETGSFVELSEYESKNVKQQAKAIAERLKRTQFKYDDLITEKDIEDAINQRFGSVYKVSNKVQAKPSSYGKEQKKEESIDLRLKKVQVLKNPFNDGKSDTPDPSAVEYAQGLVGGLHNGKIVTGVSFEKGTENPELPKTVERIKEAIVKDSESSKKEVAGKLKGLSFGDDKITDVSFDDDNVIIQTSKGSFTYNPSNVEDFKLIKEGLSINKDYAPLGDAIVLSLAKSSAKDKKEDLESRIDLTKEGAEWIVNGIYNSSKSEDLKIDNDELEKRYMMQSSQQTTQKPNDSQKKSQKVKRSELEAMAVKNKVTVEQLIKAIETQKNVTLVIED